MISSEDIPRSKTPEEGKKRPSSGEVKDAKKTVYIGGFTWWATDEMVKELLEAAGVGDVVEVKFFENKGNGQSKGFCLVEVGSEESVARVYNLHNFQFDNRKLLVRPATPSSLNFLESLVPQPKFQSQRQQQQQTVWNSFSPPTSQMTSFRPDVAGYHRQEFRRPRPSWQNSHYNRDRYKLDNTLPPRSPTPYVRGQSFRNEAGPMSSSYYGYQQPPYSYRFPAPETFTGNYGRSPPSMGYHMHSSSWGTEGHRRVYGTGSRSSSDEFCNGYGYHTRVPEDYIESCRAIVQRTLEHALAETAEGHFEKAIGRLDAAVSKIGVSIDPSDSRCDIMVKSLLDTKAGIQSQLERRKSRRNESNRKDSRKYSRSRSKSPARLESSRKRRRSRSPSKTGRRHWD